MLYSSNWGGSWIHDAKYCQVHMFFETRRPASLINFKGFRVIKLN